jgi:TRAP-type C4-dicarboxylate transport system permease large subunit
MKLGFDPIWFGVIIVLVAEIGVITPPVGINVFVIFGFSKLHRHAICNSSLCKKMKTCVGNILSNTLRTMARSLQIQSTVNPSTLAGMVRF